MADMAANDVKGNLKARPKQIRSSRSFYHFSPSPQAAFLADG
jgi:hypothetical protein